MQIDHYYCITALYKINTISMKRFAALLICLFIVVIPLFSEILSVLSTKSPLSTPSIQGKVEAVCTQLKYDKDSMAIKVSYVIPNIYVEQDTVLYPGTYFWHLDGCGVATTPGTPSYPQRMEAFVLPGDATNITLRIDVNKRKTFRSYTPTPARCLLSSNGLEEHTPENVPPIPSTSILTNGAPVQIDAITHYRDKTIVYVSFKPCFYWSRLKTTSIFEEMSYTLISDICMENKGEVTLSSPQIHQGYYVVSLLEEGEVPVYKKVLIK